MHQTQLNMWVHKDTKKLKETKSWFWKLIKGKKIKCLPCLTYVNCTSRWGDVSLYTSILAHKWGVVDCHHLATPDNSGVIWVLLPWMFLCVCGSTSLDTLLWDTPWPSRTAGSGTTHIFNFTRQSQTIFYSSSANVYFNHQFIKISVTS